MMKKVSVSLVIAFLLLVLGFSLQPVGVIDGGCIAQAKTVDQLQKKNGKYYYYDENGMLLKNSWKTLEGKKYYFKSNGAAATGCSVIENKNYLFNSKGILQMPSSGSSIRINKVKYFKLTLNNKIYYVRSNGRILMPGAYCPDDKAKLICIGSNGAYNATITKKLNQLAGYEKPYAKLSDKLTSLGIKVKRKTSVEGCYAMNGKRGQEWFLDFRNFSLHIFKCTDGTGYVLGVYDATVYKNILTAAY